MHACDPRANQLQSFGYGLEDLPTIYQLRPEEKPRPLDITLVRIGALRTIMVMAAERSWSIISAGQSLTTMHAA